MNSEDIAKLAEMINQHGSGAGTTSTTSNMDVGKTLHRLTNNISSLQNWKFGIRSTLR